MEAKGVFSSDTFAKYTKSVFLIMFLLEVLLFRVTMLL